MPNTLPGRIPVGQRMSMLNITDNRKKNHNWNVNLGLTSCKEISQHESKEVFVSIGLLAMMTDFGIFKINNNMNSGIVDAL